MRCQALAWVARHAETDKEAVGLAREGAAVAAKVGDGFQAVAGAAWPVRALAERGLRRDAEMLLRDAIKRSAQVSNAASRVDALDLLLHAAWPLGEPACAEVLERLVAAAAQGASKKAQNVLRDVVLMLAGFGRPHRQALEALPEGPSRRQAERHLEARQFTMPRPFFW
jgi:hypothetical protein